MRESVIGYGIRNRMKQTWMTDGWTSDPVIGCLSDLQPLSWVLVNGAESEETWDRLVRTWHYLGYVQMIGPRVKFTSEETFSRQCLIYNLNWSDATL